MTKQAYEWAQVALIVTGMAFFIAGLAALVIDSATRMGV